jgi:hypothetical protein
MQAAMIFPRIMEIMASASQWDGTPRGMIKNDSRLQTSRSSEYDASDCLAESCAFSDLPTKHDTLEYQSLRTG